MGNNRMKFIKDLFAVLVGLGIGIGLCYLIMG